ncbi:MAG: DUF2199 domain-containing protein [Maritimibacter sp.]|nr:DUF2199 domain-containing protein [Maritimibacter sp.]
MTGPTPETEADPTDFDRLMARGGLYALPLPAPDAWPHGALPKGEKSLSVGADSLSAQYCTCQGHRFLRAHLLLPIQGARTVLGFETWGSVSEETWAAWLAARAGGKPFPGAFAWLANALPEFAAADPVPCNLTAGPPGALPRLQPHPGTDLARAQAEGIAQDLARRLIETAGSSEG